MTTMKFTEALKCLEKDPEFKIWQERNPKQYLVHGFVMFNEDQMLDWQVGYYDPESDMITPFTICGNDDIGRCTDQSNQTTQDRSE